MASPASPAHSEVKVQTWGNYVLHMRFKHQDFAVAELDAVLEMHDLDPSKVYDKSLVDVKLSPFIRCDFPSDEVARAVASRAVLVKAVYDLWGIGTTVEAVIEQLRALPAERTERFSHKDAAWRLDVGCFGSTVPMEEQEAKRQQFRFLDFLGPVRLKKKDLSVNRFMFIEDYGCPVDNYALSLDDDDDRSDGGHNKTSAAATAAAAPAGSIPNTKAQLFVFGRWLSDGRKDLIEKYTLKKRAFLGPTSMDTELSFIMCNMVKSRPGAVILDPFVGTGSLLVSATVFGAQAMGLDIDWSILRGRKGKNLFSNFDQYSLPHPEIIRMDFSPLGCGLRSFPEGFFNAIVCDPPYGVRAGARKVGVPASVKEREEKLKSAPRPPPAVAQPRAEGDAPSSPNYPRSQPYDGVELMHDLLDSAAKILVLGGRLTYLLPVVVQEYCEADVPQHPCLRVVANSENRLGLRFARRLITMEKIAPYDAETVATKLAVLAAQRNDNTAFADLGKKVHPARYAPGATPSSNASSSNASSSSKSAARSASAATLAVAPPVASSAEQDAKRLRADKLAGQATQDGQVPPSST